MNYTSMSDHELMSAFNAGDSDAFTELYQRHLRGLLNFFYRLSWDHALSEDFSQEVVVRVFRMRRQWSPDAKFTTFLYRVARNLWIDHVRSARFRKSGGSLNVQVSGGASEKTYLDLLPEEIRPAGHELERGETLERIMSALDKLPVEQRMVFVLAEIEDMKYHDIAEVMDIPVGTVKSRMHTAISKLQQLLNDLAPNTGSAE